MSRICSVSGCQREHRARGYCVYHYKKLGPFKERAIRPARHFLQHVALRWSSGECLIWPFARNSTGYGVININGKNHIVSRLVCEVVNGQPTVGLVAAHSCGQGGQGCVNPKHMRWATHAENMAEASVHGAILIGEKSPNSKLTEKQVRKILSAKGEASQRQLADEYCVDPSLISRIHAGAKWKHLSAVHNV